MAKKKKPVERELTRKESHRRRRDVEGTRRLLIALAGLAVVLVGIIGVGLVQELVIKPSQPMAVVNGANISIQDFNKRVVFSWLESGQAVTDPAGTSSQVLSELVDEELIRQQAKTMSVSVSSAEVDKVLQEAFGYVASTPTPTVTPTTSPTPVATMTPGGAPTSTPFPSPTPVSYAEYQTRLKDYLARSSASHMTEADLRSLIEVGLLRDKILAQVTKDVPTTDEEVHPRHILVAIVTPEPTAAPSQATATPTPVPGYPVVPSPTPELRNDAQALARAQAIRQMLANGDDFATLAKEYSDDAGSGAEGGDLGWLPKGQTVPEFENAAFNLPIGEISSPVRSDFGYHIVQVLEKDPKRAIDSYTLQQSQQAAFDTWLAGIRGKSAIQKYWTPDKVPPTPAGLPVSSG